MWFPELMERAKETLGKKEDDFVVLFSEELGEHLMVYNSKGKKNQLKIKAVLTNSFIQVNAKKNYVGIIIIDTVII